MIRQLASFFFHARSGAAYVTALLGLIGAALLPSAQAGAIGGDTFSLEMVGFNTNAPTQDVYVIETDLNSVFGTRNTYTNATLDGSVLTVTSNETSSGGITTDTITISTPTTFVPTGTKDNAGNIINGVEFSIGSYNIPAKGVANPLDFNVSLIPANYSGSVSGSGFSTTSLAGGQNPLLTNSNQSLSNEEEVTLNDAQGNPVAISTIGVNSFSFTITVPEPSTYATMALGAVVLLWMTSRRRAARS